MSEFSGSITSPLPLMTSEVSWSATASSDQRGFLVGHGQQRLEVAQHLVGAPVLGQFHSGAGELAAVFLQLALEQFEQGEGVGGATRKAGNDTVVVQAPDLAGIALHDGVPHRYLAITADDNTVTAAHGKYGRAAKLIHLEGSCKKALDCTP
jgi:hypothetical protein